MVMTSVHILFTAFIFILCLVIGLVFFLLIFNFVEFSKSSKNAEYTDIINKKISQVIVFAEDELPVDLQFEKHILKARFRNLLLIKLVDSEKKFSGAAKIKIKELFGQYNLVNEAIGKIEQKKTYLIARGIRELTVMEVDFAQPKIEKLLQHSSPLVAQEAQFSMVRFKGFSGLEFLDDLEDRISEWQQLRMLISLKSLPENAEISIKKRLGSKNETVVIFTLKLIEKFQLLDLYEHVKVLLQNPSDNIRIKALQTLNSLQNPQTISYLVNIYEGQPQEVQTEIISVMKNAKDQSCVKLLKNELSKCHIPEIKVNAAQALFRLGHSDYLLQLKHDQCNSEELIEIIKYALEEKG